MAFVIKKILGSNVETVATKIRFALAQSRFNAEVTTPFGKVEIRKVRLNQKKDYCGNHPYACPVRAVKIPHQHRTNLEGADWVAFNDMVNDVLDEIGCHANVASSLCIIRKGAFRRTEYKGHKLGNGLDSEWDKDTEAEHYKDMRGKVSPRSEYPKDTPGIDCWRADGKDSRGYVPHEH